MLILLNTTEKPLKVLAMSSSQVLPEVQSLSRHDKIRLIRFIAQELEKDDGEIIEPNRNYPVWSPESAFSAAQTMMQVLDTQHVPPSN